MIALALLTLFAQTGHWEGAIRQEGGDALITVELDNSPDWRGSFEIPGSNAPPLTLSGIRVDGASIAFDIAELPGSPEFKGILGENGTSIRGTVTQNDRTVAFEMRRAGDPHVKSPPANTPIASQFRGDWTGTVKVAHEIKLILHLHSDSGTLDTANGQAKNLYLSAITQKENAIAFDIRVIGGHFEGKLSPDGTKIEGEWVQNGRTVPLIFVRVGK